MFTNFARVVVLVSLACTGCRGNRVLLQNGHICGHSGCRCAEVPLWGACEVGWLVLAASTGELERVLRAVVVSLVYHAARPSVSVRVTDCAPAASEAASPWCVSGSVLVS